MSRQDNNRELFIDQRCGTVFEFTSGITFSMDIGNFLKLQRAFQRDGIVNVPSDEDEVLEPVELLGIFTAAFVSLESFFHPVWKGLQLIQRQARGRIERSTLLPKICSQQEKGRQLRGETLGCRNGHLLAGVGQESRIRKLCQRSFRNIADGQ